MNRYIEISAKAALQAAAGAVLFVTATAGAVAQTGFSALSPIDPAQPLEVESDDFDVSLEDRAGTFVGNVVARQGGLVLTSERLSVRYTSAGSGQSGTSAAIRNARAEGNVRIASADETARGGWAEYDVAGRRIVMGGGVTLTRGANVLEGERLIIDIDSGRSRLEGGEPGNGDGRVRGLFVIPEREDG